MASTAIFAPLARAIEPITRGLLWHLPPETAHHLAVRLIRHAPALERPTDPRLTTRLAGLELPHPIGIAAGFDKTAGMLHGLSRLGFAFVEAGTVTPRAQIGNPRPRLFRLPEDKALINRFGFNNDGLTSFVERLAARPETTVIGANIGINKDCTEPFEDFASGMRSCDRHADYLTINVSSPNTPGLRDLQDPTSLRKLLDYLREHGQPTKPVFLKLAPDLDDHRLLELLEIAVDAGLSGLILCNTTLARPSTLRSPECRQSGGLSGAPLKARAKEMLRIVAGANRGRLQLVSAGGLADGLDLFERLASGANAVQIYTSFIYEGPSIIARMCDGLLDSMERAGIASVADLIGRDIGGSTKA